MACAFLTGWYEPVFPPKRTRLQIQEQLEELRKYVEAHVDVLRARPEQTLLKKLRTRSGEEFKQEKKWHGFISAAQKNFDDAHRAHFAATEALVCAAPHSFPERSADSDAATEALEAPQAKRQKNFVPTEEPEAAAPEPSAASHRPGFAPDGKMLLGALERHPKQGTRWRKRSQTFKQIATPYRATDEEAIEDYIQVYLAQEGLEDSEESNKAMQTAAAGLFRLFTGDVREISSGLFQYRIQGKHAATGPMRESREAAERDKLLALSQRDGEGAQKVLAKLKADQTLDQKAQARSQFTKALVHKRHAALSAAASETYDVEVALQTSILQQALGNVNVDGLDFDLSAHGLMQKHSASNADNANSYTGFKNTLCDKQTLRITLYAGVFNTRISVPLRITHRYFSNIRFAQTNFFVIF